MIAQVVNEKKREKAPKKMELEKPGYESYCRTREDRTTRDKLHMALTELCSATMRLRGRGHCGQGTKQGRQQEPGDDRRPDDQDQMTGNQMIAKFQSQILNSN